MEGLKQKSRAKKHNKTKKNIKIGFTVQLDEDDQEIIQIKVKDVQDQPLIPQSTKAPTFLEQETDKKDEYQNKVSPIMKENIDNNECLKQIKTIIHTNEQITSEQKIQSQEIKASKQSAKEEQPGIFAQSIKDQDCKNQKNIQLDKNFTQLTNQQKQEQHELPNKENSEEKYLEHSQIRGIEGMDQVAVQEENNIKFFNKNMKKKKKKAHKIKTLKFDDQDGGVISSVFSDSKLLSQPTKEKALQIQIEKKQAQNCFEQNKQQIQIQMYNKIQNNKNLDNNNNQYNQDQLNIDTIQNQDQLQKQAKPDLQQVINQCKINQQVYFNKQQCKNSIKSEDFQFGEIQMNKQLKHDKTQKRRNKKKEKKEVNKILRNDQIDDLNDQFMMTEFIDRKIADLDKRQNQKAENQEQQNQKINKAQQEQSNDSNLNKPDKKVSNIHKQPSPTILQQNTKLSKHYQKSRGQEEKVKQHIKNLIQVAKSSLSYDEMMPKNDEQRLKALKKKVQTAANIREALKEENDKLSKTLLINQQKSKGINTKKAGETRQYYEPIIQQYVKLRSKQKQQITSTALK